jgi:TonB family protein
MTAIAGAVGALFTQSAFNVSPLAIADTVGPLIVQSTIKVSLLVLVALGLAFLLRSRSAASRHWMLSAALSCAMAIPVLEAIVPAWHVPIATGERGALASVASFVSFVSFGTVSFGSFAPDIGTDTNASADTRVQFAIPGTAGNTALGAGAATDSNSAIAGASARPTGFDLAIAGAIVIWMTGVAFGLGVLATGVSRLAWLASRATPIQRGPWFDLTRDIARAYGLRRSIRVLQSDHPTLLVTWGFIRPTVLLPAPARQWTGDRIRVVLSHELAHIRRGDWLAQMIAELLRAIHWFNPLLWTACRHLRHDSEQACDDEVLGRGVAGPDYAAHLLELARAGRQSPRPWFPALAMVRPSGLERRISAMLTVHVNRDPLTRRARVAVATAWLTVALPLAGLGAFAQAQTPSSVTLSGTIADPSGTGLAQAKVMLTNMQTGASHTTPSDAAGRYEFVPLPAGSYQLTARVPGFKPFEQGMTLTAGQRAQQNIALTLGTVQETIVIRGGGAERAPLNGNSNGNSNGPKPGPRRDVRVERTGDKDKGGPPANLKPPMKLVDKRPVYPKALQEAGVAGEVQLKGRIDTEGLVSGIEVVVSPNPELDAAAIDAVKEWRFTPTKLNGVAVDTEVTISITFEAGGKVENK